MPALSYTSADFPFQPFTKIYSADVNQCFNDVKTLLNTTKLDYLNVQTHGLTRNGSSSNLAAGTANYVVYNDSNGDLTEASFLPITLLPSSVQAAAPAAVLFNYYNLS